uniref:DA-P36 family member n=1 Tax=Rhipicephalus appendiculatus TaxID=34631 RepID=A0A131YLL0_RHIAP
MKLMVSVGIFLLMIVPREGSCAMLNLTDEVLYYIYTYIGKEIVDYSLTQPVGKYSPSIKAKARKLTYEDGCEQPPYFPNFNCRELYTWDIYNSTRTPFSLPINVIVSHKGQNESHIIDVNNATIQYWNPEDLDRSLQYTGNYPEKKCNFSIEISVTGMFAYKVKKVGDDKPKQGLHGIGRVSYINPMLAEYDDLTLAYNISGTFKHTVTCNPSKIEA